MESMVQDQQQNIKGYRELSAEEKALINQIKELGITMGCMVQKLRAEQGVDQRWVSIGQTDLQTGIMALTRSVAQPTTF